jgi:hypothetical protein
MKKTHTSSTITLIATLALVSLALLVLALMLLTDPKLTAQFTGLLTGLFLLGGATLSVSTIGIVLNELV